MRAKTTHLFLFAAIGIAASSCSSAPPAATPTTTATAVPTTGEATWRAALAGSVRTDKERARDGARHPAETLAFAGLRDDATVLELWPGGGYYTAILAPVLAAKGKLIVTHADLSGDPKDYEVRNARTLLERFDKNPEVFGKVGKQVVKTPNVELGPSGSVDFVLTFRNVHNWIEAGFAEKVFAESFRVLKSGGVLAIEEHRGRPGMSPKAINDSGYVPEDVVQSLAEKAGFRLAGRSEINANPKDTKDYPNGVWSLPPTLQGKDVDRDKFLAIGESDRMTLRFVKP